MTFAQSSGISRRGFLGGTLAAGVLLLADPTPIRAHAADGDVTLSAGGISVLASVGGRIAIRNAAGVVRSQGSRFQIKDSDAGVQVSTGGTPSLVSLADGTPAIRMDYTFSAAAGAVSVYALVTVTTQRAHLEWHVSGPTTLRPEGFLFSRAIQSATEADRFVPVVSWVRDAGGGIPYETPAGVAYASTWGSEHGMFLLERSRQAWSSSTWIHAPGRTQADGTHLSVADFFFGDTRPSATAVIGTGEKLGVEIWTDRDFNLCDGGGQQITLTALVANGDAAAQTVSLRCWVRDFDGTVLFDQTVPVSVPARSAVQHSFALVSPAQGILTTEVSATVGSDEAFARTTIATLPPFAYTAGQDSMFGIANYPWLPVPSAAALLDLWQRAGIAWVRIAYDGGPGLPPSAYDARGMFHNIELQPSLTAGDADAAAWAESSLTTAVNAGARCFEVGNELNRPFNTGQAAQAYIDKALWPVVQRARQLSNPPKILNNGLAGMDKPWVQNFHAAGGWDLIDGFAYHPGRGNFTPDYIPSGQSWEAGATGTYWNFGGGLRDILALMEEYGRKEIWLTEAYACTRPNAWWNDTYRHAAENVLLTLVMARAAGVRAVCWYQFHDSVLGMPQVADSGNVEYHFGLMNRDVSAKPSLLAYATAARVLDQAVFVRHLVFDDPQVKGELFDTPAGQTAVIWARHDGYILNANHDPSGEYFPAPEVWVDPWPTKTTLSLPAAGASVEQIDVVGRSVELAASAGSVTAIVDGAPRVFRGVAFPAAT